jgi:hypothetical protein
MSVEHSRFAWRSILAAFLLLPVLALLAACGGDDDDDGGGSPTDAATTAPGGSPAPSGGAFEDQPFSVNAEFWHAGFHVTLGDGLYYAVEDEDTEELTYFVSIEANFENLGPDETEFPSDLVLTGSGGNATPGADSEIPSVPAGLSSDGTLVFEVDDTFEADSAELLAGTGDETQAHVPLGAEGTLVTLEPTQPPVSGSLTMELIDLTFTSAELRADVPVNYTEVEDGKLALTVNFDATSRKSGNWSVNATDFALILPGGSAVGADGAELGSLPGTDAGTDTPGLYVRFLVDDPPAGDYTLRFTPGSWFIGADGVTEATFDFSLD